MAAPALIPLLTRLLAAGGRGGGMGNLLGQLLGGGGGGSSAKPPPLPSDPDYFAKNEAWKKNKDSGMSFGGAGAIAGIVTSMNPFMKVMSKFRGEIVDTGKNAMKGTLSLKVLGEAMDRLKQLVPVDMIKHIGDSMASFVGKINPGIVKQFEYAINDMMATIGSALMPIFKAFIVYVRAFAKGIAGMIPVFQPLLDIIRKLILGEAARLPMIFEKMSVFVQVIVDIVVDLIDAFYPLIDVFMLLFGASRGIPPQFQLIIEYIKLVIDAWGAVIGVLSKAIAFAMGFANALAKMLFGINLLNPKNKTRFKPQAEPERAIRDVSIDGIKSFSDKAFEMSAKNAMLKPDDQKNDPLTVLPSIAESVMRGEEYLMKIRDNIAQLPGLIGKEISSFVKDIVPELPSLPSIPTPTIPTRDEVTDFLRRQVVRLNPFS